MLAPAKNPMPEPMADDTSPIHGPIKMPVTNMAIGAKVIVDSGGGIGIAIIVVTAIKADITPIRANFVLALWKSALSLIFFSLRQYCLVQVLRVDDLCSRPLSRVKLSS